MTMDEKIQRTNEKTFELKELDEAFWKKVVFVEVWYPNSFNDGCIWMVTEEKKVYFIGLDGFLYENNLEEFHPLFQKELCENTDGRYYRYAAEQNGWKYSKKGNALVREDLFEAFEAAWETVYRQNIDGIHDVFGVEVMGAILGADKELERWNYIVSAKKMEEEQAYAKKREEERQRNRLTEDDFVWKVRYANNSYEELANEGFYCLLLKEQAGTISGVRFTIEYQKEEISPLCQRFDAPIQEYLLFEKEYHDIRGALEYNDPKAYGGAPSLLYMNFQDTLNASELNDRGEFVRAFSSLEEAKKYAVAIASIRHAINKQNILRDIHDSRIQQIIKKNRQKKYDAILWFGERYHEILEVVAAYEFPDNSSGGGGFILSELEKKFGLDEEMALEIMQYIPTDALLPRYQRKARELQGKI